MEKEQLSILIIDPTAADHAPIRDSLRRSKVPAVLHFVSSTEEGLCSIARKKFDLVLTDHDLPKANAFYLLFELHKREASVPVILLTRDGEPRIVREAFQRGVDDYLLKEELESISFFDVIGNIIEKRRQKEEREEQQNRLRELAERDGLTGLYNHRFLLEVIEKEFARSRRYHRPFSLLMIDLDGFKSINDACGHPQGDSVLKKISTLLLQTIRFIDLAARYGGDEFAILLPETDLKAASKLAQRIVAEIRKNPFLYEDRVFPLSASIGVACFRSDQDSAGLLLREADQALYEAKKRGRDRVIVAPLLPNEMSHKAPFISPQNENDAVRH